MIGVYILKNKNSKNYIGSSDNIARRLVEHNNGNGGSFTKINGPRIIYCFRKCDNIKEARNLERLVKSYKGGNEFKKIINGEVPEWLKGAPC